MSIDALRSLNNLWNEKIVAAARDKEEKFGRAAADAWKFYSGNHDFMYTAEYRGVDDGNPPWFKMTSSLLFNMVQVFLSHMYHRNPVRLVDPRRSLVPKELVLAYENLKQIMSGGMPVGGAFPNLSGQMPSETDVQHLVDQIRALLLQWALNSTPWILDLKTDGRNGLVDALVKGRGLLWTEMVQATADEEDVPALLIPGSVWLNIDDFYIDPDATSVKTAGWICRTITEPTWVTEQKFRLERDSVKGNTESQWQVSDTRMMPPAMAMSDRKNGLTCDMHTYWEVLSRVGVGGLLKGAPKELQDLLGGFGQNIYLAISPTHPHPLNVPEHLQQMPYAEAAEELAARLEWPIPTYRRPGNPWPISVLDFHPQNGCAWPIAHATPSMGYVKAINWIFSYLIGRIKVSCKTFMLVPKDMENDKKSELLYGDDFTLIEHEVKQAMGGQRPVDFIQMPNVATDIWNVLAAVKREFEESTGVTELALAGRSEHAFRSAAEAQGKFGAVAARPEDMANLVDDWMGQAAANEAFAAIDLMELRTVAGLFGEHYNEQETPVGSPTAFVPDTGPYTKLWAELVANLDARDLNTYFFFRVEAGSSRKPNHEKQVGLAEESMRILFPLAWQFYQAQGDPTVLNSLIRQWAIANGHPQPDELIFPDLRQQMMMAQQASAARPEEMGNGGGKKK